MSRAEEWNKAYVEERTGWDLGQPPPALLRAAKARSDRTLRVLVPGGGKGHDARGWAAEGHDATLLDLAPLALKAARELAERDEVKIELVEGDVTDMPKAWTDRFDVVWEQTCLCAIPVELRAPYLDEVARVLAPAGEFLALLWNHGNEGGPPFDMPPALVEELFTPNFEIVERTPVTDSPAGRKGETLYTARLR